MSRRPVPHVTLDPEHLPLVLVGLPGAGKTTVARLLASALGLQVTDTDAEIRRRARMTVPQIFAAEGEEGTACGSRLPGVGSGRGRTGRGRHPAGRESLPAARSHSGAPHGLARDGCRTCR